MGGPLECEPSLPPFSHLSRPSVLQANQRPCQAYFCFYSSVQTHPLSGVFSLSFPLTEASSFKAPIPSHCATHPPPDQPAPQRPPGLQEPMLGGFFEHVCRLLFGSSFYTLVLCPQLLRPLAPCFVHSRCFTFVRRLSFPSLVGQGSCVESRLLDVGGRIRANLSNSSLDRQMGLGSENEETCSGSLC